MAETLIVTTSILALISTTATLTVTLSKLYRNVRGAPEKFQRLTKEIAVLHDVVDECHEVLDRFETPRYVRESLISCFESGQEVVSVARSVSRGMSDHGNQRPMAAIRLVLRDDELTKAAAVFRERVVLLRDMCTEIRMRGQLVETGAAMARLAALSERSNVNAQQGFEEIRSRMAVMRSDEASLDTWNLWEGVRQSIDSVRDEELHDARSAHSSHSQDQEPTSTSQPVTTKRKLAVTRAHNQTLQQRRSAIQKQFASLEASNYVVDATVLVENPLKTGGERFKQVSAEIAEYYPGRVKLDTGSEADFVSLNYLLQASFTKDALKSIPAAQQTQVVGIDGAKYTPKFEIDLKWFRQGEALTNAGRFLVVDQAPFDILLSSKQFAPEAARQLISLPLVRPRKPRKVIAQELQDEKKRIEAAKALEERDFQAELARRRTMGRASTMQTMGAQDDMELGTVVGSQPHINESRDG